MDLYFLLTIQALFLDFSECRIAFEHNVKHKPLVELCCGSCVLGVTSLSPGRAVMISIAMQKILGAKACYTPLRTVQEKMVFKWGLCL